RKPAARATAALAKVFSSGYWERNAETDSRPESIAIAGILRGWKSWLRASACPIVSFRSDRFADAGSSWELADAWDSRMTFAHGCGLHRRNGIRAYPLFELPEGSDTGSPESVTPFNAGNPVLGRSLAR